MSLTLFLLGLGIGFFGSIPIAGPIAILIFNSSLKGHYHRAQAIALGAAIPEALYSILALQGMNYLLVKYPIIISIGSVLGVITFSVLGIIFWRMKANLHSQELIVKKGTKRSYLLGFTLAAFNPTLLVTYSSVTIFLLSYIKIKVDLTSASLFGFGVLIGVYVWFFLAILLIKKYKSKMSERIIGKLYKVFSILLFLMAIHSMLKGLNLY